MAKLLFVAALALWVSYSVTETCMFTIVSPGLKGSFITVEEQSVINITFSLQGNCTYTDQECQLLMVSVKEGLELGNDLCIVCVSRGKCSSMTDQCLCGDIQNSFSLVKRVEKSDNVTLVVWSHPKIAEEKELMYRVLEEESSIIPTAQGLTTIASNLPREPETTTRQEITTDGRLLFLYGVDFMVVASCGIIALIVTVISVSVVCVRKKDRTGNDRRLSKAFADVVHRLEHLRRHNDEPHGENVADEQNRRFSEETNFYWEIRDDPPIFPLAAPRPRRQPGYSTDDYLHPVETTRDSKRDSQDAAILANRSNSTESSQGSAMEDAAQSATEESAEHEDGYMPMGESNTSGLPVRGPSEQFAPHYENTVSGLI